MILTAVQQNGGALGYASEDLRADREVVLAAVQQNGRALHYASGDLRADHEVVLTAVRQNVTALCCASEDLRADREVVIAAVRENGDALEYASKDLRADRETVLAAVRHTGWALQFADDNLRADREVVLAAVRQAGWAMQYASKGLRADREVVIAAVQQDVRALQFADATLRQNERFVAELADICPLGIVWCFKPKVTSAETALRAMRSKVGLLLLAKQAKVSLLGNPCLMKELLLSAMEQGCLEDTLRILIAKKKQGILDALRTVMAWYGAEVSPDLLTNARSADRLCELVSGTIVSESCWGPAQCSSTK